MGCTDWAVADGLVDRPFEGEDEVDLSVDWALDGVGVDDLAVDGDDGVED